MSEPTKAVFLSYASQDAEAAKRICDALRAAGVEVWFDQSELVGGDAWDAKIRGQIAACALFVPVISAATQARLEGYFRLEWKLAAQRTHTMADEKIFLLPVVIDATRDAEAKVPAEFKAVQWTRLRPAGYGGQARPGEREGQGPEDASFAAFCMRVQKLLGGETVLGASNVGEPLDGTRGRPHGTPLRRSPARRWLVPAILGAFAAVALAVWQPWRGTSSPVKVQPAPAAQTEAQKLIGQAWALWDKWEDTTRGDWQLADESSRRAVELERNNSEAWAVYAQVGAMGKVLSLNPAATPVAELTARAQRAVNLSPDSFEAQYALANCYRLQPATRAEAERIYLSLLARAPNDGRVMYSYTSCLRDLGRLDEALAMADRAAAQPGTKARSLIIKSGILALDARRMAEAEATMDQAYLAQPGPAARLFKIVFLLYSHGDLDGAAALLADIPPAFMLEERGAVLASQVWLWRNEPDKAIAALKVLSDDLLVQGVRTHGIGRGPRAFYVGQAQQLAGRPAAAQSEWRAALNYVNGRLASAPNAPDMQYWRAYLLALLGDRPGAMEALKVYQQLQGHDEAYLDEMIAPIFVLLDRIEPVVAFYTQRLKVDGTGFTVQILRYDPAFAALRADPRIKTLLAANASGPAPAGATSAPDQKSIAVLPFVNMSPDKENEYLSDGLTEEILNALAQVPGLRVPARTSSFVFKGKTDDIKKIGELLHVGTVLEGSVQRAGNQLRITVQLINVADGYHVWSEKYDREMANIFAIQDDIARNIVDKLKVTWTDPANAASAKHRPENVEAYELVLKGKVHADRLTETDLNLGIAYFQQAIAKQPDYAEAYAQLGRAYNALAREGFVSPDSTRAQKQAAFAKARELDDSLWEVQIATAEESFWSSHDWVALERVYRRIVEQNPGLARVHELYALILADLGRYPESLVEANKAQQLDPLSPNAKIVVWLVQLWSGNLDAALENSRQAMALSPDLNFVTRWIGSWALWVKGQRAEAIARYEEALGPDPAPRAKAELGSMYSKVGRTAEAQKLFDEVLGEARQRYVPAFSIAQLYLGVGDAEQANVWMNKAIDSREAWVMAIKTYPDDSFRSCRYYPEWLKRIGLEP